MKSYKYRFFAVDNVVFDIPSHIYDEPRAAEWAKELNKVVRGLDNWVIFCIPDISMTVTPQAAGALVKHFNQLKDEGCKGVLILASCVAAKIFHHSLISRPGSIDIHVDESMENLCLQAQRLLGEKSALNIFHQAHESEG